MGSGWRRGIITACWLPNATPARAPKAIWPFATSGNHGADRIASSRNLRRKSSVSDRHSRSLRAAQSFNLGVELLRQRIDDAGAKPGFWLGKDAVRLPNPVVSDRKLPICSGNIIRNGDLPIFCIFVECMLQRIYDEFCDNQSEALGLTASSTSCFAQYLQRDWRSSPIIEFERASQSFER